METTKNQIDFLLKFNILNNYVEENFYDSKDFSVYFYIYFNQNYNFKNIFKKIRKRNPKIKFLIL